MKRSRFYRHTLTHLIIAAFLLVYFCIGLRIYPDYGVPIDEFSQIDIGRVNYERVTTGSQEIQTHYDRYYGPAFEVPLYVFSQTLSTKFGNDQMSARHLGVFVLFGISLILFYQLLTRINGNPLYGILGVFLLAFSPRIFAESFYNTKDIVCLSGTIFVLWALARIQKQSWISLVILAIATGFTIAVRAQGLLLLLVITAVLTIAGNGNMPTRVRTAVGYAALALIAAFSLFPIFWNDTIRNIVGYFRASANPIGVPTYYFGVSYISPGVPWHYHFVWVAITSLLSVLVTSLVGMFWFIVRVSSRRLHEEKSRAAYLGMFFIIIGTFVTSVFFHPRSYDGWRHIYYIYPCMVAFSVMILRLCIERMHALRYRVAAVTIGIFFAADLVLSMRFLIRNHPNQYLYFNMLAGGYEKAKANFDMDYWGISYKQLLGYLLSMPVDKPVSVYFQQQLPYTEFVMIPALQKKGMTIAASVEEADIYVTINRDFKDPPPASYRKLYAVTVEGTEISAVYATGR